MRFNKLVGDEQHHSNRFGWISAPYPCYTRVKGKATLVIIREASLPQLQEQLDDVPVMIVGIESAVYDPGDEKSFQNTLVWAFQNDWSWQRANPKRGLGLLRHLKRLLKRHLKNPLRLWIHV